MLRLNASLSLAARSTRLFLLASCATALTASAGSLWVGESEGMLKLNPIDGAVVLEIPEEPYGTGLVAVDATNGNVWTWGEKRLRAFDQDGVSFLDIESVNYPNWEYPADLLVDGAAGNIWLNFGKNLYRFNLAGEVVGSLLDYGVGPTCDSMTLDRGRSRLWLCTNYSIKAYDASFQEVLTLSLDANDVACKTAWDDFRDELWVAVNDKLRRYDSSGQQTFEMTNPAGLTNTYFLKPDGRGGLWLGNDTQFVYIDPTGSVGTWVTPFQDFDLEFIRDAVVHPVDASIWIANETHLRRFSTGGTQLAEQVFDLGDQVVRYLQNIDLFEDGAAPIIEFVAPPDNSATNQPVPLLQLTFLDPGSGIDASSLEIAANGVALAVNCTIDSVGADCTPTSAFSDGVKDVTATIEDTSGNISEPATVRFTVDTAAPQITISSPANGAATNQPSIVILGSLSEPATLRINGTLVGLDGTNNFSFTAPLQQGQNSLSIVATDNATNSTTLNRSVTLDTQAPNIPDVGIIGVSSPSGGLVTITGQTGSVEPNALVRVTNLRTGQSVTVTSTAEGGFVAQIAGEETDQLEIRAIDNAQNQSNPAQTAVPGYLPPNPATVATPLSTTGITPFAESIAFLYSAANPIQSGVAPGTIQAEFAAVVRGSVTTREGQPLANVVVSVKDHPEYGQTRTRADGRFDLAVNGGGVLTLDYQRNGYMPLHRYIETPHQEYAVAENVVMIPVDTAVTEIALDTTTFQAHQSSVTTDLDGDRRITLMVPLATTATMTLADGSIQPLSTSIRLRATEYTVGVNGIEAMPAPLPPTSAYTYAVELSVDEAIAAGARRVDFNRPLPVYLENFLDFPVGMEVPVGYYDRELAAWVASENGRVVEIVGESGGLAQLDIDGSGEAADAAELTALGVSTAERQRLASLYDVGASFWRFAVTHFSPWDCNFPYDLESDADAPPDFETPQDPDSDETDECEGCSIEAHTQALGQSIAITGTPFSINYRSDRARKASSIFDIRVTDDTVPSSLAAVLVRFSIGGREVYNLTLGSAYSTARSSPVPNQTVTVAWDGKDAYGRPVLGSIPATLSVTYGYLPVYTEAPGMRAFGVASTSGAVVSQYRGGAAGVLVPRLIFVERKKEFLVNAQNSAFAQLGGWTLSAHHSLDVGGNAMYLGDGTRRNLTLLSPTIGNQEGPLASRIRGVTAAPSGAAILAMDSGHLRASGIVIAGGGTNPPANGLSATSAQFGSIADVDSTARADTYFTTGNQVWRRDIDGLIWRVAGTGASGSSGDGSLATSATLNSPSGVAVDRDGTVYVAEAAGHRIRRIGTDGIITTHAGTGAAGFSGDNGPAAQAQVSSPRGIALTVDGALLIADQGNARVRRIDPTGTIRTIAGSGSVCSDPQAACGDGNGAVTAQLSSPNDVDVLPSGEIVVADNGTRRLRAIRSNGRIVTLAGNGTAWITAPEGDAGPALGATLSDEVSVGARSDGTLFIGDRDRTRAVAPPPRGQNPTGFAVPSEDGTVLYQFDLSGRHLSTVDALTGVALLQFSYDAAGRVSEVTDRDGNTTSIERAASGTPLAIMSADGQRTPFTVDSNGYLASVDNPAGERIQLQYGLNGLMTRYTDARGNFSEYEYSPAGRLISDASPDSAGWDITRTVEGGRSTVSMTSAENRTSQFVAETTASDDRSIVSVYPDATESRLTITRAQVEEALSPDGTRVTTSMGPDPRFGMRAPLARSAAIRLPSGLTQSTTRQRTVALSNSSDPLSVVSATELTSINGRQFESVYTAATRQIQTTSPEGRGVTSTLDTAGRLVSTDLVALDPVVMSYDARGRVSTIESGNGIELRQTRIDYHGAGPAAGLPQTITDPEGRITQLEYDSAGRLTRQILPGSREVAFTWDANGNLTSVTPPGRTAHVFDHTGLNLRSEYAPPAAGLPVSATTYSYNLDRQLTLISRPDSQQLAFGYGASGKLDSVTSPRGVISYTYNAATGQLAGITDPSGESTTYGFDGALLTATTWTGAVAGTVGFSYDNNFFVSGIAVNGQNISLGYDGDGLLTNAGSLDIDRHPDNGLENGTALGIITTVSGHNTFGELDEFIAARPTSSQNDIADQMRSAIAELGTYLTSIWSTCGLSFAQPEYNNLVTAGQGLPSNATAYDAAFATFRSRYQNSLRPNALFECGGQATAFVNQADASVASLEDLRDDLDESGNGEPETVYAVGYQRDRLGRITQKTEVIGGDESVYEYDYDAAGRLVQVEIDGSISESYSYDANGNRLVANGMVATYDEQDRLLTLDNASFTYTANGELLTRAQGGQVTTYGYDLLGNLMSVALPDGRAITYVVDGENRRVGKRIDGQLVQGFLYQGQLQIGAELDGSGNVISRFVYGTKANVPDYMIRGGVNYRIVSDHIGSPRLVINAMTGEITQRIDYDSFGNVLDDTNPGFQPFGFAGGLYDRDTALIRFGARDYDPGVGRWTAKDQILFDGPGANLYGYVLQDPINLVDLEGELPSLPQGLVDFSAGLGDALLFGFGDELRDLANVDGGVAECSNAYFGGQLAGLFGSGLRGAYVGAVAGLNRLRNLPGLANREKLKLIVDARNALKDLFRGPFAPLFPAKPSVDALIAAKGLERALERATATNPFVNAYALGVAGGVVANQ